jgi:hypothetical protein
VIIELKRPGKVVAFSAIVEQIRRYVIAAREYFRTHPDLGGFGGRAPIIDTYILVESAPTMIDADYGSLRSYNGQIITYAGLISRAREGYQEYLDAHVNTSRIDGIVSRL